MLNEEIRGMIEVSRKFVENEIKEGVLEADLKRDEKWLLDIWEKGSQIGYPSLVIPEEYGGTGQSDLCAGLVLEAFAYGCAGAASLYAGHFAACRCLSAAGGPSNKKYLAAIAGAGAPEDGIAALILPSQYDDNRLEISRIDGGVLVSGKSGLTSAAGIAGCFCVFCEDAAGKDIICFIAGKGMNGISIGENPLLPGLKVNPFAPVIFDNHKVSDENIISIPGKGADLLTDISEIFYGYIAAISMGAARAANDKERSNAVERYQYGKIIISHSEIQRMLGAMRMKLSVGTSAYMAALSQEGASAGHNKKSSAFAKIFCADSAVETAIDAIQIHGGYGYMHEYGIEKIMRDAKVLALLGGSGPELCVKAIEQL